MTQERQMGNLKYGLFGAMQRAKAPIHWPNQRLLKVKVREHERFCEVDLTNSHPDKNNNSGIPYHSYLYIMGHKFFSDQTNTLAWEKNVLRFKENG